MIVTTLSPDEERKIKVLQPLIEPCDRATYGKRLRYAAEQLGISVRSVQREIQRWEKNGIAGITRNCRADKGKHRISDFWQNFIIKTYKEGNTGSKRMTPKQVAVRVQAKAHEMRDENPPHYRTVLRVLKPIIERQEKTKSIRSPGWKGSTLSVKTRSGEDLVIAHSNHVWQCDHTPVDVMLVDQYGEKRKRPWLTIVIDSYSRCIMGINLGFDAPSSQVVALALRHAILPKHYGAEYKLNCEWGTYGKPVHFYTDGGKDFRSNHVQQIGHDLGFTCHLRDRPSEGGIVERPFKTLNEQLFSTLPGYTDSNVQKRPKDVEKDARLTLRDLERLVVRFICDCYNQSIDARIGDQTRFQRWEAGLPGVPDVIGERLLDPCLMNVSRRTIQRGGYLQFKNLMYRGEYLAGYAGEIVSVRFNPDDITTLLVYRRENNREVFLTRAFAQGLETEQLSLSEAQASSSRRKEAGKSLSNTAIFQEVLDRDALVNSKKSRKQRHKEEQKIARSETETPKTGAVSVEQPETAPTELEVALDLETETFEPIDFEELQGGW
ncbi:MAG: transposase [Alkalinema sp. CACIAM 70d]|nr:MAG: transposase [Alkalinema sp. CACIAM 70d]